MIGDNILDGFSDPRVWGLVLLFRVFLGALIVLPFLYFVLQICLDFPGAYEARGKSPSWQLILHIFKNLFRSPRNIFLACLWISVTIYVFGFAYIWPLGAKALPYKILAIVDRGHYPKISVVLEAASASISGGDVAATCMAAGKYYSEKLHRDTVTVKVYAFPPSRFKDARLGQCTYGEISTAIDEDLPFRAAGSVSPQKIKEIHRKPVVGFLLYNVNGQAPINPEKEKILFKIVKIKNLAKRLGGGAYDLCSATNKDESEKRLEHLKELTAMIHEDTHIPQEFKILSGLLTKYANLCARKEERAQVLSQIDDIIYTD